MDKVGKAGLVWRRQVLTDHLIDCCHRTFPADLFQKLPLYERPLLLRLIAGPDLERLSFVLKENETGDVEVRNDQKAQSAETQLFCQARLSNCSF